MHDESGTLRAVYDAMVVRYGQGQHQPRNKLSTLKHRLHLTPGESKDGDFRGIDDGSEGSTTYAPETGNGETAPFEIRTTQLLVASPLAEVTQFGSQLKNTLLIHITNDRDHQAFRCIDRNTNVEVFLQNQRIPGRGQ